MRHSDEEKGVGKSIGNVEDYLALPNPGGFLFGSGVSYIFFGPECDCELDVDPSLARTFLERMAATAPVFGYAYTWEELRYRNGIFVEIDGGKGGSSRGFNGRDISKYVPGLYWLTLLPEAFAKRHGVPLDEVAEVALEHADLGAGQHLFRFYDRPEDWRERADVVDGLCARLPGIFDIHHVRGVVGSGVKSFAELRVLLRPWR